MKPGTILHTIAVLLSSLVSMIAHPAQAKVNGSKMKKVQKQKQDTSMRAGEVISDAPPLADPPRLGDGEHYAWKTGIVTTTFWIGERPTKHNPVPNHISSWDSQWAKNYGGTDDPDPAARRDFIPIKFTPQQNPFYIALPYNDKMANGHKPEAPLVIPWFKKDYTGPEKSVCKGRWIAIKNPANGQVCYAQWEDAGPFRTDHWQYVFGNERPKPNLNKGAGLDVSPAVRDFLGMNDTDVTDWKFVDFDEVPEGPWAKHGENNTFVMNKRKEAQRLAQVRVKDATLAVD